MGQPLTTSTTVISPPPPAPRGVEWIGLEEAARRTGLHVRTLRRRCIDDWSPRGLARCGRPASGGKAVWTVREDAAPGLARVATPELIPFDARQLTDARRRELFARHSILTGWERAKAEANKAGRREFDATAEYLRLVELEHGLKLSRSRLFAWRAAFRADGLAGLVDNRWQPPREKRAAEDPFLSELHARYFNLAKPRLTIAYRDTCLIAKKRGWPVRSYFQSRRYVGSVPLPTRIKLREGDKAYKDKAESYIERDYSTLASNEIWCADHHRFDVWVRAAGRVCRPWLTAWSDVRSRKIVGWHIGAADPNQDTILLAFRHAIHPRHNGLGVPHRAYMDNGKDFRSRSLNGRTKRVQRRRAEPELAITLDAPFVEGLFSQLGVETTHCEPYNGQSKHIERFFGTLEDRFGRGWPTYCGNSPANRPQNVEQQVERGNAPTLGDFVAAFGAWLHDDYHNRAHAGDGLAGRTPDEVYAENLLTKRTATSELLDYLLMQRTKPLVVTQNGVRWMGRNYGQDRRELFERLGQQVSLRYDPMNVDSVVVCELNGRPICPAAANVRTAANATYEDLRAVIAAKRRRNRFWSDYHDQRPRAHEDTGELLARQVAERLAAERAAADPAQPPNVSPIQTPFDDAMPALQRAMERQREDAVSRPADRVASAELVAWSRRRFAEEAESAAADEPDGWHTLQEFFARQRDGGNAAEAG